MLEHDPGAPLLAQHGPEHLAEGLRPFEPLRVPLRIGPVRREAPVRELLAVDHAHRPQLQAELRLVLGGDHGHGAATHLPHDLDGHGTQSPGPAPDQYGVSLLDHVRGPAHEHPVGSGPDQRGRGRLLPRQVRCLGQALVRLDLRELGEGAPVRLVAPDPVRVREPRVAARGHEGIVGVPLPAVDHDVVPHPHVGDAVADGPHRARGVAPADVEVVGLPEPGVDLGHVDRDALRRPHVVVVDARGHHQDQGLARAGSRRVDRLDPEGLPGLAEPLRADHLGVHLRRDLSDRRDPPHLVELLRGHVRPPCRLVPAAMFPPAGSYRAVGKVWREL